MGRPKSDAVLRREIKSDLLGQLSLKNISGRQYINLIDDYMMLWDVKNSLVSDIKNRGVAVKWNNGGGQKGYKKNDSVSELVKVNAQMLKLLAELGLRATEVEIIDDDTSDV